MKKMRPGASKVIREAAARILPFAKDDFTPTGLPAAFQVITDELLVVAEEAVASVCAAVLPTPPSLASQQRLLAWVVADTRGATTLLEKPLALVVGKRLEARAKRVRGDGAMAVAEAAAARDTMRAAAANNPTLAAVLDDDLAAIDENEKQKLDAPKKEVYTGFHELQVPAHADVHAATGVAIPTFEEWVQQMSPPLPIPEGIARLLGDEGCHELRKACARYPWGDIGVYQLVNSHIPSLVKEILFHRAQQAEEIARLETRLEDEIQAEEAASSDACSARDELEELRAELLVANTRVSTLQGVINDHVCREAR